MAAVSYDLAEHGPSVLPVPLGGCSFCHEPSRHGERGNSCPVRVVMAAPGPQ